MQNLRANSDFRRLWAAMAVSAVGARITRTALPMLAILTIDATAGQVAMLATLTYAPGFVVSLFGGGLADRRGKRRVMIAADLLRAIAVLTVPLAAWTGVLAMPQLYMLALVVGAGNTAFSIADNAFLPVIVPEADLVAANARLEATDSVAEGIGPWLGGVLVGAIGAPLALAVDGVSYLWSAFFLRRIETTEPRVAATEADSIRRDISIGLGAVRADALLSRLLVVWAILPFFGGFLAALYLVLAIDVLGLGPGLVGFIIGAGGLGSLIGAWAAPRLLARRGVASALLLTFVLGKICDLALPLTLVFPQGAVGLMIFGQIASDACFTAFGIFAISARQERLAAETAGRANACFHMAEGAALICGTLAAGAIAATAGTGVAIWIAALGGFLGLPLLWGRRV